MPVILKIHVDSASDEYVELSVLGRSADGLLKDIGTLRMSVGEYQLFGAALSLGAERTRGALVVEHYDEEFIKYIERQLKTQ